MERLASDAIYQIAMRIEEPVDLLNFSSVNKRILNLCDDYKIWKKHAKKYMDIDIPNSKKEYLYYANRNKEVDDFITKRMKYTLTKPERQRMKNPITYLRREINDRRKEILGEVRHVIDTVLEEQVYTYFDDKTYYKMTAIQDNLLELPKKINQTLNDKKINFIDKKYTLYQIISFLDLYMTS